MKKKIYLCPNCGRALNFSDNPEYTFQCFDCDENFYEFEAIEKEQNKLEGVQDFTDMIEAAMEIKAIKDKVTESHERYISIKSNDIVGQICEYIYETIRPVLETNIYKSSKFRNSAAIYTNNFRLEFGIWSEVGEKYFASLATCYYGEKYTIALFNKDRYKKLDNRTFFLTDLVKDWINLKNSMNRMIPYAIKEYNAYNQKEVEKQEEEASIIDGFKL